MKLFSYFLFFLLVCLSSVAIAQDAQFTQFYANPIYINPAFAGTAMTTRACLNMRNQWNAVSGGLNTGSVSLDHNFINSRNGIGGQIFYDKQGSNGLQTTVVNFQYAYGVPISNKIAFRPGVQIGYGMLQMGNSNLLFTSVAQGQLTGDNTNAVNETTNSPTIFYPDIAGGGLFYSNKMWLGFAAHHINTPNQSFYKNNSTSANLPIKFSIHAGYKINIGEKPRFRSVYRQTREKSITPAVNFRNQGVFNQIDVGVYTTFEPFMIGAWYRGIPIIPKQGGSINNDALCLLIGLQLNEFTVGYSYDYTVSKLTNTTNGTHEISLIYVWASNKKAKDMKMKQKMFPDMPIPCPNKKGNSYGLPNNRDF
jgi:type IX secretion system PorP/SprF family membrane protein